MFQLFFSVTGHLHYDITCEAATRAIDTYLGAASGYYLFLTCVSPNALTLFRSTAQSNSLCYN
jgi:hypothetical protein